MQRTLSVLLAFASPNAEARAAFRDKTHATSPRLARRHPSVDLVVALIVISTKDYLSVLSSTHVRAAARAY